MNRLTGRKIVVMGGTSGIGLASARRLADMGASVVVTGRDVGRAKRVRQENPDLLVENVDATSPEALRAFCKSQGLLMISFFASAARKARGHSRN